MQAQRRNETAMLAAGGALAGAGVAAGVRARTLVPSAERVRDSALAALRIDGGASDPIPLDVAGRLRSDAAGERVALPERGVAAQVADDLPTGVRSASDGVLELFTRGSISMGSGWVVEPDLVVTNYHVVDGTHGGLVDAIEHSVPGTVVAVDEMADLAVVHMPALERTPLLRATAPIAAGDAVYALGFTSNVRGEGVTNVRTGEPFFGRELVAVRRSAEAVQPYSTDAGGWTDLVSVGPDVGEPHGMSGGPVVDADGRVVAVVSRGKVEGGIDREIGPTFARVEQLLQRVRPRVEEWRAGLGASPTDLAARLHEATELVATAERSSRRLTGAAWVAGVAGAALALVGGIMLTGSPSEPVDR